MKRIPLERALSKLGIASRTEARRWIEEGRVAVGGRIARDPLEEVDPDTAELSVDGSSVGLQEPRTILLNKPRGVVTTRADEKDRPTVYHLLEGAGCWLVPVGRLDFATTGLLLMTNDTVFSAWVTDPENEVPRVYVVTVRGELSDAKARSLEKGIRHEGDLLQARSIVVRKRSRKETHLIVELAEGKNREIRRMMEASGHPVTALKRISFGGLGLPRDLQPGKWLELSRDELMRAFPGAPLR